ncbi:MAG TPA: mechanosensitive ion channel family protein [Acidimicrobiales bacterium]|nr:mechanosensitive ion channel family protein [Acidimicrobiales bacterium]
MLSGLTPLAAAGRAPSPATASNQPTGGFLYQLIKTAGASADTADRVQSLVLKPLEIVVVLAAAYLVARLGARVARRAVASVQNRAADRFGSHRAGPRLSTMGVLAANVWRVFVWVIAGLVVLGVVGVNLAPFLAGATVVGAALGFGAQTLVRDLLAGFFIVAEDQYGVGDAVRIGNVCGSVEELTFRVTRLRAEDGSVWFVANGEVRQVANTSILWSRAEVDVPVPQGCDPDRASQLVEAEASALAADPDWAPLLLERPQLLGLESLGPDGATLKVVARTPPRQSARVAREMRRRVASRLTQEGIYRQAGP